MKRSKQIRLLLLGGISAGALAGCSPGASKPPLTTSEVYTNDFHVPGAGYYHAPFHGWFELPYNYFDKLKNQYYFGGRWGASPNESIINISFPTPDAVNQAEEARTDVTRGGFGGTWSGGHSFFS